MTQICDAIELQESLEARAKKLIDTKIRLFFHDSFKDLSQRQSIIGNMPDLEKFNLQVESIKKLQSEKIGEYMRPCYEGPLLTFDQEQHLFRKMNYFKFKAKKMIRNLDLAALTESNVQKIESYFSRIMFIRNQIAESNFRLVSTVLDSCNVSFYRQRNIVDSLISDAYFNVLKAVDYFDWTKGYKFSTYAIWVMKKNFFHDCKAKKKYADKFLNTESDVSFTQDVSEPLEQKETQDFAQMLLTFISKRDKQKQETADRIVYILQNYFGLNGYEKRTLENISEEIGVTKERVRQLKEEGLSLIKKRVEELGLTYEMGV